jgi:hypothetical protein
MLAVSGSIVVHVVNSPLGGGTSNDLQILVRGAYDAGPADKSVLTWGADTGYTKLTESRSTERSHLPYRPIDQPVDFDPGPGTYPVSPPSL